MASFSTFHGAFYRSCRPLLASLGLFKPHHIVSSVGSPLPLFYLSLCRLAFPIRTHTCIDLLTWQFAYILRLRTMTSCFTFIIVNRDTYISLKKYIHPPTPRYDTQTMVLALGAAQKRALSVHFGDVILDFYHREPPL